MDRVPELGVLIEDERTAIAQLLDTATVEHRPLKDSERTAVAALTAQLQAHERELQIEREQLERARGGPAPAGRLPWGAPALDPGSIMDDEPGLRALPPVPARSKAAIQRLYADVPTAPPGEVQGLFAQSVMAVLGGQPLHPSIVAAGQSEGVLSEGGATVPAQLAREIFTRSLEESVWIRCGIRVEPMLSDELTIAALDDADDTTDASAGVVAGWAYENSDLTPQTVLFRSVTMRAKKLAVLASCSRELAEDAMADFFPKLEGALIAAIAKRLDRVVLGGGGAAEPSGILNSPGTVSIAKETVPAQIASTIVWENVTKMWAALAPGLHETSCWVGHPSALPQLLSLQVRIKNQAGTDWVGGGMPAVFESGPNGVYRLLGRPLYLSSRAKVLGQPGDLILLSPESHVVGIRRPISVDRSEHVYFASDAIALRARFRGDSCGLWNKTKTLVGGGGTVGSAVTIAIRS